MAKEWAGVGEGFRVGLMAEVLDRMIAVIYPYRCVLCGDVVEYDDMCCGRCGPAASGLVRLELPHRMKSVAAPFFYETEMRAMILRFKETGDKRALRFMAERMAALMTELWPERPFDLLVPVPTSEARRKERGFNPTELITSQLGPLVNVPVEARALARREASRSQRELSAGERRENAARSYRLADGAPLSGKSILLVDDVVTTGATLAACSALLLGAGSAAVHALAAAHTRYGRPDGDPAHPPAI